MTTETDSGERRRGGVAADRIRILIVDDHALFRVGIANILSRERDLDVVGEAADGRAALEMSGMTTPEHRPDGPVAAGARAASRRPSASGASIPATAVIVMAQDEDEESLFASIKAGAAAFVIKDISPEDLIHVIRRVSQGEFLINDKVFSKPAVASRVLKEFRELAVYGQEAQPIFAPLSPREVEILDNIAQGMTNKQVAYALSISEQTVKNHMSSILRKLAVNDRTQAVVYAMRQGWIKMPED